MVFGIINDTILDAQMDLFFQESAAPEVKDLRSEAAALKEVVARS